MYKLLLNVLLPLVVACGISSCQKLIDEEMEASEGDASTLKVTARSGSSAQIMYPAYLYAFTEEGEYATSQKIASEETAVELSLPAGNYRIVAVSGVSKGYVLPEKPSLDNVIAMEKGNFAQTPMMIGKADVAVGKSGKGASVDVSLTYAVSSLFIDLKNIPAGVTGVKVILSPLYTSLSMDGEYGGEAGKVEVECTLDSENRWSANGIYIFPGSGEETVCSIVMEKEGDTETYGYTYAGVPLANHPFNLVGDYKGEIAVGGNLVVKDWDTPVDVEFEFGNEAGGGDDDKEEPDGGEDGGEDGGDGNPTGLPEVGSLWNGCIVAATSNADSEGADLLLMSLEEWEGLASEAEDLIADYDADGIGDWRLPTEPEAKALRDRFNGKNLEKLNEKIAADGSGVEITDIDDPEWRYLCKKAGVPYSFQFIDGKRVTKAGTQKLYLIRAVTTYRYTGE